MQERKHGAFKKNYLNKQTKHMHVMQAVQMNEQPE